MSKKIRPINSIRTWVRLLMKYIPLLFLCSTNPHLEYCHYASHEVTIVFQATISQIQHKLNFRPEHLDTKISALIQHVICM